MKRFIFLFLIFGLLLPTSAQKATTDSFEQSLRRHVEYLASEKLEGRRTGEKGAMYAAGYISNQFSKFKLRPGFRSNGSKPNFLQSFPYVAGVTLGNDNFLRIIPADQNAEQKMEVGVNWMPLGYSMSGEIGPADLLFAGFGVVAAEANYDDYKGLDVTGKIVLMFDSTPDAGNPHSPFARFNIHTKANIAKDKGAKAIILIAADNDFRNDRLSRLVYERTLGETAIPVAGIMRSHGAALLGAKDENDLNSLEKSLATTSSGQPHEAETRPVGRVPKVLGTSHLLVRLVRKTVDAYNVIGILEGTDPQLKNEAIIIGAHYDHLGRGGHGSLAVNSTDIHYGADDNASGTAAVIEIARLFAGKKKNRRTLIFMAFGGEEEGLLGSKHYVNDPVWPLNKTIAMINLDMVGRLKDNKLTVGGIGTATQWRGIIEGENVGSKTGEPSHKAVSLTSAAVETTEKLANGFPSGRIPPSFTLQLNEDGFGPSDHSSFYGKQIPVLFLFTGTHTDYHKPTDTFEKINYEGLARVTNYVRTIVEAVDQNPTKPTYAVAKSSGQMGQIRMSVSLGTIPSYGDSTDGMLLDGVRENSPAARAGLKPGDKVVKLAGKDVRNAMDYTYVLGSMKAGEEYEVEIIRGTERMTLKVIPAPAARRP